MSSSRVQTHAPHLQSRPPRSYDKPAPHFAAPSRAAHGGWAAPPHRPDPVKILIEQSKNRISELLPIRYGRMQTDPFAFLRGTAAVMASDLSHTPTTNIRLQACGDAHLNNFGSIATSDGLPVFDISDFDETLPAPFE